MFIGYFQNFLFTSMIAIYSCVIYQVHSYYTKNDESISSILKNTECNKTVFTCMTLMGVVTLLYELLRCDVYSFLFIFFLLYGIYGVIIYDYTNIIHFFYCFVVFASILLFMYNHCLKLNHIILYLLLYIQEILCALIFLERNIMNCEIYLLLNFAIFYIYLHFVKDKSKKNVL
jgi:hypothetical protein